MSTDPYIWQQITLRTPLPEDGQLIRVTLKDGTEHTGCVKLVWLCMDTPCIDIETADGVRHCYPELGDRWEAISRV